MTYGGIFGVSGRTMVALKILNFSFSLGKGALVPFFTVYFRLVGINAFQSGLLGSVRWILAPWSLSLWKFLSEKTGHRKAVLLLTVLLGLLFNVSLVFVGNVREHEVSAYSCEINTNSSTALEKNLQTGNSVYHKSETVENLQQGNNGSVHPVLNMTQNLLYKNQSLMALHSRSIEFKISPGKTMVRRSSGNGSNLESSNNTKIRMWKIYPRGTFDFSHTFFKILMIMVFGSLISAACPGLINALTNDIVQQNLGNYGIYKILCSFGTVLSAMLVGVLIDNLKCVMHLSNSFALHFCLYAVFTIVAVIAIYPIDIPLTKNRRCTSVYRILKFIVTSMHTLVFITTLIFIGTVESVVYNFLFWYMMDIGTTVTNMGLVITLATLPEILVSLKANWLTNLIGNSWILFLILLLNTFRLLYFSYMRNPWLIPLTELIYGFIRPLMWSACKSYAIHIAPYGTEESFQTVFTGLYHGIGMGIGGISMGFLYQLYGPVVVFRCAAGLCGVFCLLLAVLFCVLELPDRNDIDLLDYEQVVQQDSKDKDWLLEALSAEDEVTHFTR